MDTSHGRRRWRLPYAVTATALTASLIVGVLPATADDGAMMRRTIGDTPDLESEHSQLSMMQYYVPATRSSGALVGSEYDKNPPASGQLEYYKDDPLVDDVNQGERDELVYTRGYAKPLIITFSDEAHAPELPPAAEGDFTIQSGVEVGVEMHREAMGAISLDDGETWKITNLSEGVDETSFTIATGQPYYGDVTDVVHSVAGNKVLVAWASKYCDQGSPRYAVKDEFDLDADGDTDEKLYPDPFGVKGNQRSIDYTTWMHHGDYPFAEVGEVPFSCIWTARGTVEQVLPGTGSDLPEGEEVWGIRWRKPERLTSGRRDAFKLTIDGVEGAGFALAWQEDPEGLRPGYGEGPGIGWSGSTVNHKADIWYSNIGWDDFDTMTLEVEGAPDEPVLDPTLLDTNKPKVFERMAMPVRMTDNEKCDFEVSSDGSYGPKLDSSGELTMPWCFDLDEREIDPDTYAIVGGPDGVGDLCPVEWQDMDGDGIRDGDEYVVVDEARLVDFTNAQGKTMKVCVSDDGRMLNGQTGSSRARLTMEGYTRPDGTKSAWVAIAYEESKGLGAGHELDDEGEKIEALDIGKDTMYHSFDLFEPDVASDGHMLNPPETASPRVVEQWASKGVTLTEGGFLPLLPNDLSVALNEGALDGAIGNQWRTSIARRVSLATQPGWRITEAAADGTAEGMTSAMLLYKGGADRQGGPADIFMRRTIIPADFDPATDNPFAVENLACDEFDVSLTDNGDPLMRTYPRSNYPDGLCVSTPTNLSGTTPLVLEDLGNVDEGEDPPTHGITERVLQYEQTEANLRDEDWTNKYDMAKGHRGFIDGDFVMMMYGYTPNWLATSKGHEPYNLFIRRSFDGGETWTTTPADTITYGVDTTGDGVLDGTDTKLVDIDRDGVPDDLGGDGTTYDQVFGVGQDLITETRDLAAGVFEPARNVSQLTSNHETVLDPRYSPTNIGTQNDVHRVLIADESVPELGSGDPWHASYGQLADEVGEAIADYDNDRDPSKFFAVYETGDATVVLDIGEADPWDLFASRATNWGDDWASEMVFAKGRGEYEERWDWVENKDDTRAGESAIAASPGGQFAWIVWNEWVQDELHNYSEYDPRFRRLWWDDSVEAALTAKAGLYTAAIGATVELTATAIYDGVETLSFSWDLDRDGVFETSGQTVSVVADGSRQGVAVEVCTTSGVCDIDQGWINGHAPQIRQVEVTPTPAAAGTPLSLTARFRAHDDATYTATVDWGSGPVPATVDTETYRGSGTITATLAAGYPAAGLHTPKVTLTRNDLLWAERTFRYATVYSQKAGTLDGKGQIQLSDGKASFEVTARYTKSALEPTAKLSFSKPGLTFTPTSFEWLVVNQNKQAFLRGQGTVNGGTRIYEYLVSGYDGKTSDAFRIKIWRGDGRGEKVLFDTQPGAPLGAQATTPVLKGGKLTIELR
jgi:hypothetical protein